MELDEGKLLHIWTEVHLGRGTRGGFLRAFAEAYIRADETNLVLIREAAKALVIKFSLDEYLDNYGASGTASGIVR